MSCEMNTMTMSMPVMQQGPVAVQVRCFEATPANIATVRSLAKSTAADGGEAVTAAALLKAGMKATTLTVDLTTTVKSIRADLSQHATDTTSAESTEKEGQGAGAPLTVFALARAASHDMAADPLISLVDALTVAEIVSCPQVCVQHGSSSGAASLEEVCVGDAKAAEEEASLGGATAAATLVLFYRRDAAWGCSDCCLGACLGAICATLCCWCCIA